MRFLLVVGVLCVAGAALIGLVTSAVARLRASRTTAALVRQLGARNVVLVDPAATRYPTGRRGAPRSRSGGCLVLATDEVVFAPWLSARRLHVSRLSITEVRAGRRLRGGSRGRRLLRITWTGPDGSPVTGAWQVADPDAWQRALRRQA